MATDRKDAVTRFLEFLRFRTISGEGPAGSYEQVRTDLLANARTCQERGV